MRACSPHACGPAARPGHPGPAGPHAGRRASPVFMHQHPPSHLYATEREREREARPEHALKTTGPARPGLTLARPGPARPALRALDALSVSLREGYRCRTAPSAAGGITCAGPARPDPARPDPLARPPPGTRRRHLALNSPSPNTMYLSARERER